MAALDTGPVPGPDPDLGPVHLKKYGAQKEQRKREDTQIGIWSSILSQEENDEFKISLPPPYVHPLVKRSASSLSDKSLEICTESLGSETGSDGFSSYAPSESCDSEPEEKEQEKEVVSMEYEFGSDPKSTTKRKLTCPYRPFPPPLPSLGGEGSNLHMRCHRRSGRLVAEAVSVPSRSCFRAERHDGRLLLMFSDHHASEQGKLEVEEGEIVEEESLADNEISCRRASEDGGGVVVEVEGKKGLLPLVVRGCNELQPWKRSLLQVLEPQCIATS